MKPLDMIRYVLIGASLIVMFFNLFSCIINNRPMYKYLLYVGLFLVIPIVLTFFHNKMLIIITIYLISTLTMTLDVSNTSISYAVSFMCFLTYLKRDVPFRVIVYFTTLISAVSVNVFTDGDSIHLVSVLISYICVYALSELVYKFIVEDIKKDGKFIERRKK